jgi:hypothetical protein
VSDITGSKVEIHSPAMLAEHLDRVWSYEEIMELTL